MTRKQHWQNSKRLKGMKDEMLRMNRMLCDLVNGQKMNEFDWLVHQVYEIEYRLYRQPIKRVHHHPFDCQVSIVRIHSSEKSVGFASAKIKDRPHEPHGLHETYIIFEFSFYG